jgi:hypothetical protein
MHMDDSKTPISSNELDLRSASDRRSAVDELPADLAGSRALVAHERHPHSDQITPWQNDRSGSASTVVYCDGEERVCEGFLIALKVMGIAVVEEPVEAAPAPRAREKQRKRKGST